MSIYSHYGENNPLSEHSGTAIYQSYLAIYWSNSGLVLIPVSYTHLDVYKRQVQNIENKPAVKIDTVLSADKQTALQFPGRVKAAQDISCLLYTSFYARKRFDGFCKYGQLLCVNTDFAHLGAEYKALDTDKVT